MRTFGWLTSILALLILSFSLVSIAQAEDPPGKKLFLENKCNTCHAIESQGIEKTGKMKAPDLSDVGSKFKADWIAKYLQKEEAKEGKKHPKGLKTKPEDITTLSEWLESLKK